MEKQNSNLCQQWQSSQPSFQGQTENTDMVSINSVSSPGNSDFSILDEITSENMKIKHELDLLSIKLDEQRKSQLKQNQGNSTLSQTKTSVALPRENLEKPGKILSKHSNPDVAESIHDGNAIEEDIYDERRPAAKDLERECRGRDSVMTNDFDKFEMAYLPETRNWCKNQYFGCEATQSSIRSEFQSSQLYEVSAK